MVGDHQGVVIPGDIDSMKDETIILLVSIISITIIQIVAMCELHLDGVVMSTTVATIVGIALKSKDISNRIRGEINGRDVSIIRNRSRSSIAPN